MGKEQVTGTAWTEVGAGMINVDVSNMSSSIVLFELSPTDPGALDCGHPLNPGTGTSFVKEGAELLWARSTILPRFEIIDQFVFTTGS